QQYEVRLSPAALAARQVSLDEVYRALQANNANAGGGVIERAGEQLLLRGEALLRGIADIQNVVVRTDATGSAVLVRHLGEVALGSKLRTGVITRDGQGEEVAGVVLMLFGANSRDVSRAVTARVGELERELPRGVHIVPYYNRSELINRTLHTVETNLVEGAGVVLFVLIVCLGSWRAGVLVAFAIPFAMLFALLGMRIFGVSGNLMSLGAIDFGIVVDGAVVIVERMLHAVHGADDARAGPKLSRREMMLAAARGSLRGVMFSVGIILLVYVPLGTLEDVEGKMFRPMVATMVLALAGAMLYTLLVVPAFGPWLLARERGKTPWLMRGIERIAAFPARFAVNRPWTACAITLAVIVASGPVMLGLGAEFIPRLEEGALALDVRRLPSVSLTQSVLVQTEMERILRTVPEVRTVVSRTGRPEGGTDPAGPESSDCFVFLHPPSRWRAGLDRDGLVADVSRRLRALPGVQVSFSQPIEMRVSDLIAGVKSDVAIKIFGEDMDQLRTLATQVAEVVRRVQGAADTKVETTTGLPTMRARVRRDRLAALGVDASAVLDAVQASRIGRTVGAIYDGPRRFDLTVRLDLPEGLSTSQLGDLPIGTRAGRLVPLGELADVQDEIGDVQISREDFRRRVVVETNVRGRDLVSFVADARAAVARDVRLPEGVRIEWGGQFANFERAKNRLGQVVPIALGVIAVMLLILLGNAARAAIVFLNVPLAIAGGAVALAVRGLTFSIPAGVGLIAVSGLAVLSGVLVVQALAERPLDESPLERVLAAARDAVRPVATAALVAAIGFIPMAIASSAGAEVQRPLATVVI
ncbi:MAG: CusA/CzcA family heavy metal efflux RND transporter, partial [Deltaproteobacteria bacterium]